MKKMKLIKELRVLTLSILFLVGWSISAQILEVKQGKSALIKEAPTGNGNQIGRLDAGTQVVKLGEVPMYYSIQLADGSTGFSYKGNFKEVQGSLSVTSTKESLWAQTDVQIYVHLRLWKFQDPIS